MESLMDKKTIVISAEKMASISIDDLETWLTRNVGGGGRRYKEDHNWMGADDWFYHVLDRKPPEADISVSDTETESEYVFVFRRERDASMFGLKWA
jgi:hypothetical protein